MKKKLSFLMLAGFALSLSTTSYAQISTNWTGGTSADWSAAGNWDNGVPGPNYSATLPAGALNPSITLLTNNGSADYLFVNGSGYSLNIQGIANTFFVGNLTSGFDFSITSASTGNVTVGLIQMNAGNLTLTANVTNATINLVDNITSAPGNVTVNANFPNCTINLSGIPSNLGAATVNLNDGDGVLVFNNSGLNSISTGIISGLGKVSMVQGNSTLSANNTYSGGTTLSAGTLIAGVDSISSVSGPFGTGLVETLGNANIATTTTANRLIDNALLLNSNTTLTIDTTNGSFNWSGDIEGSGTLNLYGNQTVKLSGNNNLNFNGTLTVQESTTLTIGSDTALGSAQAINFMGSGTLNLVAGLNAPYTLPGTLSLALGANVTMDTGATGIELVDLAASLTGSGNLFKTGSSNLTIQNSTTITGNIQVDQGNLLLTALGSLGSINTLTLNGSTSLDISGVNAEAIVNNIRGAGSVNLGDKTLKAVQTYGPSFDPLTGVISGSGGNLIVGDGSSIGYLFLGGVNTYTGFTTVASGQLHLIDAGSIASSSYLNLQAGSTFDISGITSSTLVNNIYGAGNVNLGSKELTLNMVPGVNYILSGQITGSGSLQIQGGGNLTLSGSNSYAGDSTILGSTTLIAGSATAFGSSASTLQFVGNGTIGTTLTDGYTFINDINIQSAVTATLNATGGNLMVATNIAGSGNLLLEGSKTITLSGINSYTGTTTFNSLNLNVVVASDSAFGASSGQVILQDNAKIISAGNFEIQNPLLLNGYALSVDTTLGNLKMNGPISALSSSSLVLLGSNTVSLGANNSGFLGSVLVSGGTLNLEGSGDISNASSLTLTSTANPYAFDISRITSPSTSINNLSGNGNIYLGNKNLNLAFTADKIISGNISGASGSISISGSAVATFTGNNTYSGGLFLQSNTQVVAGSNTAFGSGDVTFNANATIGTLGNQTLANDFNLNTYTATFDTTGGNLTLAGDVYGSGNLVKAGINTLTFLENNSYSGTTLIQSGTLALSQNGSIASSSSVTIQGIATFDISGITLPSTVVNNLSGGGLINLGSKELIMNESGSLTLSSTIYGNGSMVIQGGGVLTLSGNSSYLGNTTIDDDTTIIVANANAFGSSSGSLNFVGNGTIKTTVAGGYTFLNPIAISSGVYATLDSSLEDMFVPTVICGLGNLKLMGNGLIELGGNNSYQGLTQLGGDVHVVVSNANSFGNSSSGIVLIGDAVISTTLNSGFTFLDAIDLGIYRLTLDSTTGNLIVPTLVSGSGQIEISGSVGSVLMSNQNSYSGGTLLSGTGLLILGSSSVGSPGSLISGPIGKGALTISANGTLAINGSYTIGNAINASSSFKVDTSNGSSGATLTLTGPYNPQADFVNLTKMGLGELRFKGDSFTTAFSSTAKVIAEQGTLTLASERGLGFTYLPTIELSGGAELKIESSPITNLGYNLYNPVTINGDASLYLDSTTSILGGFLLNASNAIFTLQNGKAIFNQDFVKTAGVSGTRIEVAAGAEFNSNRSLLNPLLVPSDMLIYAQGILSGNLSVSGNVNIQGTISPGGSIGTIAINGNYVQSGTYLCDINRLGASDLINITGSANLTGGTLTIVKDTSNSANTGYYIHDTYTLLQATGGLGGTTYDTVNQGLIQAFTVETLNGSLVYTPTSVLLNLGQGLLSSAKTANEAFIYESLIALNLPNADQQFLIDKLIESKDATLHAAALSGEQYSNLLLMNSATNIHLANSIYNPLRKYITDPCAMRGSISESWYDVSGIASDYTGDASSYGFTNVGTSLAAGVHTNVACDILFGANLYYEYNDIKFKEIGSAYRNTVYGGVYGLYRSKNIYLLGEVSGGYSFGDMTRNVLDFDNKVDPKATLANFYGEFGFDLYRDPCSFLLQPFIGVNIAYNNWQTFQEEGFAATVLSSDMRSYTDTITRMGVHLYSQGCRDTLFGVDFDWAYQASEPFNYREIDFNEVNRKIWGLNLSRSSLEISVFASKNLSSCVKVYLDAGVRSWAKAIEGSILAGVTLNW